MTTRNIMNNLQMREIDADIAIKQKQIEVEVDSTKKSDLQNQLQVLRVRKQIIGLQQRIEQLKR